MTDLEIYKETQELAFQLASILGFTCSIKDLTHNSKNPRMRQAFALARAAQEKLNHHEMEDVVTAYEEKDTVDCPACSGTGKSVHSTYGTVSDCWLCRGKGSMSETRLDKLKLL